MQEDPSGFLLSKPSLGRSIVQLTVTSIATAVTALNIRVPTFVVFLHRGGWTLSRIELWSYGHAQNVKCDGLPASGGVWSHEYRYVIV